MDFVKTVFLSPEELETAVLLLRQGDTDQLDAIISHHIPGALAVAAKWVARHPRRASDIKGAAMVGLTRGANAARLALVDNRITPYLWPWVTGEIRGFLEKDYLIPVPKEQVEKHPITLTSMTFKDVESGETKEVDAVTHDDKFDIEDMLRYLDCTPVERAVITHRMDGAGLVEIGIMFGKSREWVGWILRTVSERYLKKENTYADLPRHGRSNCRFRSPPVQRASGGPAGSKSPALGAR